MRTREEADGPRLLFDPLRLDPRVVPVEEVRDPGREREDEREREARRRADGDRSGALVAQRDPPRVRAAWRGHAGRPAGRELGAASATTVTTRRSGERFWEARSSEVAAESTSFWIARQRRSSAFDTSQEAGGEITWAQARLQAAETLYRPAAGRAIDVSNSPCEIAGQLVKGTIFLFFLALSRPRNDRRAGCQSR